MTLDKLTYLVKGSATSAVREKIRLKLRLLLNKHKNPRLIITDYPDQKLKFELERLSCKTNAVIYSSTKYQEVFDYWKDFGDLYFNEWVNNEDENLSWIDSDTTKKSKKVQFKLLVACKSARRSF